MMRQVGHYQAEDRWLADERRAIKTLLRLAAANSVSLWDMMAPCSVGTVPLRVPVVSSVTRKH